MGYICRQTYIFFLACLSGILAGFIFDIFRVKRKLVRTPDFIVKIEDILYWIIIAIVLFCLMYYSNECELRSYILLGLVLGVIVYICLFSKYIVMIMFGIFRMIAKLIVFPINIIIKILHVPLKFTFKILHKYSKIF